MNTRKVNFQPDGTTALGRSYTHEFPAGVTGEEADRAICNMYGKFPRDIAQSLWVAFPSSSSGGSSVTGAVIGGTVGLVGAGLGWIGSSIKEGMDEADREEAEAKAEGGERLAKWEKDQANTEKWVGRFGRYGGAYVGIGVLSALGVELLVTPLALGMMGYISYKVVSKTINKLNGAYVKPNRPTSVQPQYRKETI